MYIFADSDNDNECVWDCGGLALRKDNDQVSWQKIHHQQTTKQYLFFYSTYMPLPINSTKAKKTTFISLWFFCLSFLFQALCFVIVFYVLDIFWIKLTFLSLGLVTLRALLIACLSFSVCVWCLFFSMWFYVLDFLVDIGIFPHGPGCSTSSFDPCLSFVSCVFFFLSFQCVRFSGLYWHFPPSGLVALSAPLISCLRDFRSASFDEQESLRPERLNIFNQIHLITIQYTNTKMYIQNIKKIYTFWPMWETSDWLCLTKRSLLA